MKSHYLAIGTLALLSTLVARPATSPPRTAAASDNSTSGQLRLHVSGGRTAQQRLSPGGQKLDAALAELTQHVSTAASQPTVADLHALNPAAKFIQRASDPTPLVSVDAITRGDPQQLERALVQLGLQNASVYSNDVGGWLPVTQIDAATALSELHSIHAAMSRTRSGAVTSQGDFAQHSDVLRTTYSTLTGSGITVGAISDSYNCYPVYAQNGVAATGPAGYASNGFNTTAANDVTTGDLPSGVNVVKDATCLSYGAPAQLPFGDEGRSMLQIVHDVAPGASLSFYTAEPTEANFASGIGALQKAGAKVIVDDVGYFDEPFFQDGEVAQAIDAVAALGVAYFSAAGNDASDAYDNTAPSFATLSNTAPTSGEYLLNFDNSGATTATSLSVDIPSLRQGELVAVILQWDQPYVTGAAGSPGASSHLNLCVTSTGGTDTITNYQGASTSCTGANSTGSDPVQIMIISNPANAAGVTALETIKIAVGLADGTAPPTRLKLAIEGGGLPITIHSNYAKNPTLQGHPGAAGAAAVGAAPFYKTPGCGVTPAVLETFSSQGGTPILFDKAGNRLTTATTRQKPNFVAPDAGYNTFLGFDDSSDDASKVTQCLDNQKFPNFLGTSAAAPHAAAIAALMMQANSALTPAQIIGALQSTALPMGSTTPDFNSGYGFIQADAALPTLPPGAPTLSFDKTSVTVGGTATLTWSSINVTACTASGSWTGTQATGGTATITAPTTAGTATYTLTCNNAQGSASGSATLTATAASSSTNTASSSGGGGGGAIDGFVLFVLAGLGLGRLVLVRVTGTYRARAPIASPTTATHL
jgi:hypothetical protein